MVFLLLVAVWAVVCVGLARWRGRSGATTSPAVPSSRRESRAAAARARLRMLPEGHRPPPGLTPLSPSERFLTQEAARGMRELQLFLAEKKA